MQHFKKIITLSSLLLCLSLTNVNAQSLTPTDVATICDIEGVFTSIVQAIGILVGLAFFVMIILGGMRYLLSGGDPKAVQAAKSTLTWGILGLAFFAISYTILLLIQAFTGVNVTLFKVCGY